MNNGESLCNCKEPLPVTHYAYCVNCCKSMSWEVWLTYWEKKVEDHKANWG